VDPRGSPPGFAVETDRQFVELEVASDPILFNGSLAQRRRPDNFFTTGPISRPRGPGRPLRATMDAGAWRALSRTPALYYRGRGYEQGARGPERMEATVADLDYQQAPSVQVVPAPLPALRTRVSGRLQWLRVQGNLVIDEHDRAVVLRGVNRSGLEWTDRGALDPGGVRRKTSLAGAGITRAEIREIVRHWEANVIRLPINQEWALTRPDYLGDLDEAIALAAAEGAYTLLTVRWFDARRAFGTTNGQPSRLPPMPEENTLRVWRQLASRYKAQPSVLYDLFSAPHEPLRDDDDFLFERPPDESGWIDMWHAWLRRMEAAVHRVNDRALLVASGWNWGLDLRAFPVLLPRAETLPNTIYASHLYYSDEDGRRTVGPDEVMSWLGDSRVRSRYPISVTEWGGEVADVPWGRDLERVLREHHTHTEAGWGGVAGWTAWGWADPPLLVERGEETRGADRWRTFTKAGGHNIPTAFGAVVRAALRQPPRPSPGAPEAQEATAPVAPVRWRLEITDAVGPSSANRPADVRAVQLRLVELGELTEAAAAAERPAPDATAGVPGAQLPATVAAIRRFQVEVMGMTEGAEDGKVTPRGETMRYLNRVIARPTADRLGAVGAARDTVKEEIRRGVTLTAAVGDVPAGTGNAPDEVRAVQRRLIELGDLAADHGEPPLASAASAVPSEQLTLTLAAIRAFQSRDVAFWTAAKRGPLRIVGDVTPGVVAPGDATHQLLDRIANYVETFPDQQQIRFRDYVRSDYTTNVTGVELRGTARPEALPTAEYLALGLSAGTTAALRFVSRHEGRFDALNTYDVARVSFGWIQFAGNRGLPRFMALTKSRQPAVFVRTFQDYGIDVEYDVSAGEIRRASLVVMNPASATVERGILAEERVRDDKRLSAVFVRAGRDVAVQRCEIEAATRDYLLVSLDFAATHRTEVIEVLDAPGGSITETHVGAAARTLRATPRYQQLQTVGRVRERSAASSAPLRALLRSEQGIAVAMDRAVQEGSVDHDAGLAGLGGVGRVVGALRWVADRRGLEDIAAVAPFEGEATRQVVDDFAADVEIAGHLDEATLAVTRLAAAGRQPGATVAGTLGGSDAPAARTALDRAIAALPRKSFITIAGPMWEKRSVLEQQLTAERRNLDFDPPPPSAPELSSRADAITARLRARRPPAAVAADMRTRVQAILDSDLARP
jgi:Cellulase (glycosyl hydrolase family 5)